MTKRATVVGALVALVVAQQLFVVPGDTRVAEAFHDALHVPWLALVTCGCVWLFGRNGVLVAVAVGVFSELLQGFTGREPSWLDLVRNGIGLLGGIGVVLIFTGRRWLGSLLVCGTVVVAGWPVLEAFADRRHVDRLMPILFDPKLPRTALYLEPTTGHRIDTDGVHLSLSAEGWPGVHVREPSPSWAGYSHLRINLTVDAGEPIDVFVGVRLTPGEGGSTHYVKSRVDAKTTELEVALSDLLPDQEASVYDLFVYSDSAHAGRTLSVRQVALVSRTP